MPRSERQRLEDMLRHARDAMAFTEGRQAGDLTRDRMLQLAIFRCLEIIGEAASHLSEATRNQFPDVPWHQIIGLRNRLIHDYPGIDDQVIWTTIHGDPPELVRLIEDYLR